MAAVTQQVATGTHSCFVPGTAGGTGQAFPAGCARGSLAASVITERQRRLRGESGRCVYQRLWCFVINPPVFLPLSNLNRLRDTELE